MIGSRVAIEKLLLNTETVNRLERYWNFLLDIILFLDPIVIFNRSNALLPTVKLYVENVDNLSRQQSFDSFSDELYDRIVTCLHACKNSYWAVKLPIVSKARTQSR